MKPIPHSELSSVSSEVMDSITFDPLHQVISTYIAAEDIPLIKTAFEFAKEAHMSQSRATGEPYITHPLAVTLICASWRLDKEALMAALLHDVMEDQDVSKNEIVERFGAVVADLVDGLSKLDRLDFATKAEQQAESFRKMLLAMAKDVRVILVKLADRLHNMQTLGIMSPVKRRRIAHETLEIYAPIANRLGLNVIVRELQDLCFQATHPNRYDVLSKALASSKSNRREVVQRILEKLETAFPQADINAKIHLREKTLFSIYSKMQEQKKTFSEILDVYGFRIVVSNVAECYLSLGVLHQVFRPIPGKFKDYIAIPKVNGYQSLHTTLIGPFGTPAEFQVRTNEMHQIAERGVAAHWLSDTKIDHSGNIQKNTHQWLQSLLSIQDQTGDSNEFIENVKIDLFPDEVYVFTPKGRIISLPRGATALDFAYYIHTDVGNKASAALINGEYSALRTELKNGDTLQIETGTTSSLNTEWLNFAKTGKARSEIRHYLRTVQYSESVAFGERLLRQECTRLGVDYPDNDSKLWEKLAKSSGAQNRQEILADIGLGKRLAAIVARRFMPEGHLVTTTADAVDNGSRHRAIRIQGNEGLAVQLAKCCTPIPGDKIMASIRPGHGLVVHTDDCPSAKRQRLSEPERWTEISWDNETAPSLPVRLEVILNNEQGMLSRVAAAIAQANANISHVTTQESSGMMTALQFTVQVKNRKHLAQVIKQLRRTPKVQRIVRVKHA